jgi:hypothetical protein
MPQVWLKHQYAHFTPFKRNVNSNKQSVLVELKETFGKSLKGHNLLNASIKCAHKLPNLSHLTLRDRVEP